MTHNVVKKKLLSMIFLLYMVVQFTTLRGMKMTKAKRKSMPMQVRLEKSFMEEIKQISSKLQISSCDLVRLSVATQLKKIRSGQLEIGDLVEV